MKGPVRLCFNLDGDSSYLYTIKNIAELTQQVDKDNSIAINQNITIAGGYKVVSAGPSSKLVTVTYERITMSSGNQLFSLDYDSENDNGTDVTYEGLRNLIDESYKMKLSGTGEIIASEPLKVPVSGNNVHGLDDSSIRKIMVYALCIYPDRPVDIGDIWERTYQTSFAFADVRIKNKFQLVSLVGNKAHVELQGRITPGGVAKQGSDMRLSGTQQGTLDIDVRTGLLTYGKITQQLSGTMNITGSNTPVTIESEVYIMGIARKTIDKKK